MSPPFAPCLPTRALSPPSGARWVHEIKHDGYRLIARRVGEQVTLRTRGGYDWAERYPRIVRSVLTLRVESVALDGEVVWLTDDGVSDFDALLAGRMMLRRSCSPSTSWSSMARTFASGCSSSASTGSVGYCLVVAMACNVEHLEGDGAVIFRAACRMGLEGIVSKRADSRYQAADAL